jgi:carnitine-CoA ligase
MVRYINPNTTVRELLERCAAKRPDHPYCISDDTKLTYELLDKKVNQVGNALLDRGLGKGQRVAVMLAHHVDHILTILALAKIGAVLVPINVELKGVALEYIIKNSEVNAIIADRLFSDQLLEVLSNCIVPLVVWRHGMPGEAEPGWTDFEVLLHGKECPPPVKVETNDLVAICYTSGTTGSPKGVLITDKMYRASAISSLALSQAKENDILLFWEPMYHMFGIEVLMLAVTVPITLAVVERFSASKFIDQARKFNATHIHYVGGVPQLLLKQQASKLDRTHNIRIAWGGGFPAEMWSEFRERFGVKINDSFGMTETSSLNLINTEDISGAIGKPLPYYDILVVNEEGDELSSNEVGELLIKGKEPGLITKGYFKEPEATSDLLKNGWLHTGDLVLYDDSGVFFFFARKKDSVRRRGENISAWEVERVINDHPKIQESALIAVKNEFGDEDLKIFVKLLEGQKLSASDLVAYCEQNLPRFQVPRFIEFVTEFQMTPTLRIKKEVLSRSIDNCWDKERNTQNKRRAEFLG